MSDIDFSYANLKRSEFQVESKILKSINLFRTNLQYASLNHGYFIAARLSNASSKHHTVVKGTVHRDLNLLLSATSTCEKRIPDIWKVESGAEDAVFFGNHRRKCRFSLKEGIKNVILTQNVSLSNKIWERDTWPVSYGIIDASMSDDVLVKLLGIDEHGSTSNSIVMSK